MTREEDLFRIAKKLDKMVSRSNMDGALDLLQELKGFNMTLKLLQNTRIGMSVNAIRKHCTDEQVISLAKFLIKNWKRLLESGQTPKEEKHYDGKNGAESSTRPHKKNHCAPPETESELNGSPTNTTPEMERALVKTASEIVAASSKNAPEMERAPSNITVDKERIPIKITADKERIPIKITGEKERVPSKITGEKERVPSKITGEKERVPSKITGEKERVPSKITEEKESDPTRSTMEERMSIKIFPEEVPSHKRSCGDTRQSPESLRKLSAEHRKERHSAEHKAEKERKQAPDPKALFPPLSLHLHPPPPPKRPTAELKERKEATDPKALLPPLPLHLHPPPPPKCPTVELKKESRKGDPSPKALCRPLTLHHHPPPPPKRPSVEQKKERKEAPDPKAPFPPLPLHLHPPPPPKRPQSELKKERSNSTHGKPMKHPSTESRSDRKDSSDSKASIHKNISTDRKKERKESSDSRPSHVTKRLSSDGKSERRDVELTPASSPPAKKLCGDRRDSLGSKTPNLGLPQRKSSTDSVSGKEKPDTPKTPISPLTPPFSPAGGPLPPYLLTGDSIRDKCIEMLSAALRTEDDYKEYGTNCDSMAAEIEDYIYQEIKATDMKYKNRVRSRISNLKDPKNPGLRKNVLAGSIELQRIASMTAEEMASDELKQLRSTLTLEAIREHQMAKTGGTTTDLLQCPKCKKKNCTYNQVQTRSADEPMTTFVLCNECGNRWKFC